MAEKKTFLVFNSWFSNPFAEIEASKITNHGNKLLSLDDEDENIIAYFNLDLCSMIVNKEYYHAKESVKAKSRIKINPA